MKLNIILYYLRYGKLYISFLYFKCIIFIKFDYLMILNDEVIVY